MERGQSTVVSDLLGVVDRLDTVALSNEGGLELINNLNGVKLSES